MNNENNAQLEYKGKKTPGIVTETGAFLISDPKRDAQAEQALESMACDGLTLEQAAKAQSIHPAKLRGLISRNTDYDKTYARIKISRYVDMIEKLISFVDEMPDIVPPAMEFKLRAQLDAYKFAVGKYDIHVAKAVEQAGLTQINVQGQQGSRIVIQTASLKHDSLSTSADTGLNEIQSQEEES